jgi:uncharacterized protein (DUF1810 family)
MKDPHQLKRFVSAQALSYRNALEEVKSGKKTSHWMWFIFPQYKGLGNSTFSIKYSIKSREEAKAYLDHPTLGPRLIEITKALLSIEDKTALEVFGSPDDIKLKSSMTLFNEIIEGDNVFNEVLQKYFGGENCLKTIGLLKQ